LVLKLSKDLFSRDLRLGLFVDVDEDGLLVEGKIRREPNRIFFFCFGAVLSFIFFLLI